MGIFLAQKDFNSKDFDSEDFNSKDNATASTNQKYQYQHNRSHLLDASAANILLNTDRSSERLFWLQEGVLRIPFVRRSVIALYLYCILNEEIQIDVWLKTKRVVAVVLQTIVNILGLMRRVQGDRS